LTDFCQERFYRLVTCDLFWLFSRRLYSGECITYLVWIIFQGRNLSNSLCGILENRWFHKYILTSSDLLCLEKSEVVLWLSCHIKFKENFNGRIFDAGNLRQHNL
jgi:hypothetical protein